MRIDHDTRNYRQARADCAHPATGSCIDQIRVMNPVLSDVSVIDLHPESVPCAGQKVEEGLIGGFDTCEPAAVLFVDRSEDFRSLGRAIVRKLAAEIVIGQAVCEFLVEQTEGERAARAEVSLVRQVELT